MVAEYSLGRDASGVSMNSPGDLEKRAATFSERHDVVFEGRLGFGFDGNVFRTNRKSAVKFLKWEPLYVRERDAYLRLRMSAVQDVAGLAVPLLILFDDELLAIEMSVVKPPFIVDFAGAFLDEPPEHTREYTPEEIGEWHLKKLEQFEERWPHVQRVIFALHQVGIYLTDVNPKNIQFEE